MAGLAQFCCIWRGNCLAMSRSHIKTPYTQSYNLTVERQITKNMVATVGYVGNNSRHGFRSEHLLFLGVTSPTVPCIIPNTSTLERLRFFRRCCITQWDEHGCVPRLLFGGAWQSWIGERMYNSLQAKLEKRFSDGLSFLATYTWSHALRRRWKPRNRWWAISSRNTTSFH